MKKIFLKSLFIASLLAGYTSLAQEEVRSGVEIFNTFTSGEIVCSDSGKYIMNTLRKSKEAYDSFVIGVFQESSEKKSPTSPYPAKNPVRKDGVCMVKCNNENGFIKKGDVLTSSSTTGVAMKATKSGIIVGVALEDANTASGLVKIRVLIQYVK